MHYNIDTLPQLPQINLSIILIPMKKIIFFVLIIAAALFWYAQSNKNSVQTPVTSNDTDTSENTVGNTPTNENSSFAKLASNSIYIAEQRPGKDIIVNIVNIESAGYVVIHESTDGKPGAIIGQSALIETTTAKNTKIVLKRPVKDGEELIAMLHAEKGGTGFDASTDTPVLDTTGAPLHMIFQVNATAPDPASVEVMF